MSAEVLDALPVAVLLVGEQGRIEWVNKATWRLFHLTHDPRGKRPLEAIPVLEVHQLVDRHLAGKPVEDVQCSVGAFDVLLQLVAVGRKSLVIGTDVSRFRQAERARTDFVANVSHELRTPITAIMGYAETVLVDRHRIPEDVAGMVGTIYRNATRLRDLFEDLLQLHRIETRRRELPLSAVPLLALITKATEGASEQARSRQISVRISVAEGLKGWANPEALSTMVSNLAINAVNYTDDGGAVVIEAAGRPDEAAEIVVTDNGVGIDPVHHLRIFERFFRVDPGRSRSRGGTGLGLAIVKHLAQASGCAVTVESAPGKGSRFTVRLPPRSSVV
jgi:two-component system phosphate regulon sensor histidine kinase PhoR